MKIWTLNNIVRFSRNEIAKYNVGKLPIIPNFCKLFHNPLQQLFSEYNKGVKEITKKRESGEKMGQLAS